MLTLYFMSSVAMMSIVRGGSAAVRTTAGLIEADARSRVKTANNRIEELLFGRGQP
jgi:hypothetical protein